MNWKSIAAVVLFFFSVSLPAAELKQGNGAYYYSDGARVELTPAEKWIAVRFLSSNQQILPSSGPKAVDLTGRRDLVSNRLSLLPIRDALTKDSRVALVAELMAMPEIELIAPVYRSSGALMIVSDEFIASFADGIPVSTIDLINQRHGVDVVRRLRRDANTWLLRVNGDNALATANTYHDLAGVVYAHPDFVRVMPPRPADFPPRNQRVILASDGSFLPPDTIVEKARNDLLIVEPATEIRLGGKVGTLSHVAPPPVAQVTLKEEDFEGAFPNDWSLYGDPTWNLTNNRSYLGSWSGYGQGSSVDPPGPYVPNTNSWMVFGPFSLSDAIDARVNLQAWVDTEATLDYLYIGASIDDASYNGQKISGGWAAATGGDGWMNISLDLKRLPNVGSYLGEEQVWIGILFHTDESMNYEGVYVDNIVIEKITSGYDDLTSDEFDHLQWDLSNNGQQWGSEGADIQAVNAWGVTHGSDVITIAILDQGVDLSHPDLAAKLVAGYDATGGGSAGGQSGDDAHGTACAGSAAAITDNALGVAGIAREANIMPVRIFYTDSNGALVSTDSGTAEAIDWAVANGADVLSNSWGGGSPATVITEAIADAKSGGREGKGTVVTFSTGNSNTAISYPATLDSVIAVGATSPCDERKSPTSCDGVWGWGSNYGPEIDIVAPGVRMYTTDISGAAGYDAGDYYYDFGGTSAAAPVVAGVAALLLGQDPTMTATEVEVQLMATADDLEAPGWDQGTGFGRVNAYRALTEVLPACYPLSIDHIGLGSDPIVTPPASPGCEANWFHGEAIVTLTASPSPGWEIGGWSGTNDDGSASTINTVTMPASAHAVSVNYTQIPCYTLTLVHSGLGADPTVNLENSVGCSSGDYHAGEVLTLVADPAADWAVGSWSGTNNNDSFSLINTVTMPAASHDAMVNYVEIPPGCYILHRDHTGLGSDPLPTPLNSPSCPGGTYSSGETIWLDAAADNGWTVGGWTGTDDDGSFLWTNSLDMPVSDHTVAVKYVTPTLVKDVHPGSYGAFNRSNGTIVDYTTPVNIGSTLFFAGNDGVKGAELWKSDGTASGTVMVKDIWPGGGSAFPWSTSNTLFWQTLVDVDGILFFIAADSLNNYEVWKSDGTEAGTVMVKDIYDDWDKLPANLTSVGSTLFFTHTDGINGEELWKSDGSEPGTVMVKDIFAGPDDSSPRRLAAFDELLIFSADDGSHGVELWISDGTEGGTVMLKDINTAGNSSPKFFTQINDTVFFSADDGEMGHELWKSDGTGDGTVLVKEIAPPGFSNRGSNPNQLTDVNGTLFFTAEDIAGSQVGPYGREVWKSDGTEVGTVIVKDIMPGSDTSNSAALTNLSGTLFFTANFPGQGNSGAELWRSDGSELGTYMVKDTWPGVNPTNYRPDRLKAIGGALMFTADDSHHGRQLWFSDGTEAETFMVADALQGSYWSAPFWMTDADGVLFFRANDGIHGTEIWALTGGSICHFLSLNHTGLGADPVATPTHTTGCDVGFFEAGEVVTLTASPGPDWVVGGWTGSDNDGSSSLVNTATIPDADHVLTVHYSGPPLIFRDGFE